MRSRVKRFAKECSEAVSRAFKNGYVFQASVMSWHVRYYACLRCRMADQCGCSVAQALLMQ